MRGNLGVAPGRLHLVDAEGAIKGRGPARERHLVEWLCGLPQIVGMEVDILGFDRHAYCGAVLIIEAEHEDARYRRGTLADLELGLAERELRFLRLPGDFLDGAGNRKAIVVQPEIHAGQVDVEHTTGQLARGAVEVDIDRQRAGPDDANAGIRVVDERHESGEVDVADVG